MKVIPVIDILDGNVVHGVQGKRESYKPIKSVLTDSCEPLEVAKAFRDKLGLKNLYIADLNSIEGKGDNFDIIRDVKSQLDVKIMLDYGIRCSDDLNKDIVKVIDSIILGTETLKDFETVENAMLFKGEDKVIVSIDMKGGKIISNIERFKKPEYAIRKFHQLGINNFILLDLTKVGSMQGPSNELKQLISDIKDLNLNLTVGGGIRSLNDIVKLQKLGINAFLLATALHNGKIKKATC